MRRLARLNNRTPMLDQMTSGVTAFFALGVLLLGGCVAQCPRNHGMHAYASEQALPLIPGETIRLVPTSIADPPDGIVAPMIPPGTLVRYWALRCMSRV